MENCVSYEYRNAVKDLLADKVLMAVGRSPNLDSLNLVDAGIDFTPRGITVDAHFQTSQPGIYAVGDINGICQ
ncbi:MAG: FAD-dependent oxidoreductase [Prevotellamassilia sp.]